ncbi:hypothetical protein B0H14DRAFT_3481188 [Mycena olivaceomarginata]|nr:hypothetical protein B0H14DRAFT_3481188 [Mycena olivaceomarginata]
MRIRIEFECASLVYDIPLRSDTLLASRREPAAPLSIEVSPTLLVGYVIILLPAHTLHHLL